MRISRATVVPILLSTVVLLLAVPFHRLITRHPEAQGCPAISFLGDKETVLFGGGLYTVLIRQSDGSYTALQGSSSLPFPRAQAIPNFQNTLTACGSANAAPAGPPAKETPLPGAAAQNGAVGDLTGKGDIGVVIADYRNGVAVYQGAGLLFKAYQTYATGKSSSSARIADFNGDGFPDLAVTNEGDYQSDHGNVSILLGKGDGTFQPAVNYPAGNGPESLAIGDLNGDGKLDIAVANPLSNDVSLLMGKGNGTFQPAISVTADKGPFVVMIADVNKDGKPDLTVVNRGANNISVLLGNGNGTFHAAANFPVGNSPNYVTAGDFDGDGKLDMAVSNAFDSTVSILLGNGDGTLKPQKTYVVLSNPAPLIVTDFDGDGHLDVVVGNGTADMFAHHAETGIISVLLGNGDGTFQGAPGFPIDGTPQSVAAADFNGDGKPDLVAPNQNSGSLTILLRNGSGFQPAPNATIGQNSGPVSVTTGDFNGDGKQDIAVANSYSATLGVLFGNGDGTFKTPALYPVGSGPRFVIAVDLNGDGHLDLAVASAPQNPSNGSGNVSVLLGNPDGTFKAAVAYAAGTTPVGLAAGDFNGDGKADLAVVDGGEFSVSSGGLVIFAGKGDGALQTGVHYDAGVNPSFVGAGDVNGDGKLDLVVTTEGPNFAFNLAVFIGKGDGGFQPAVIQPTDFGPSWVSIRDFNGDGKADLIVAHCCGATDMTFSLGNGDGTFQPEVHFAGGASPRAIAVADLNVDGLPDIAVADYDGKSVTVLVNTSVAPPALANVSAASFELGPLARESIVSAFGPNLASKTAAAKTLPLPTLLGGDSVSVKDSAGASRLAPLFFVSPGQINYQVPEGAAAGAAKVTVTGAGGVNISANVPIVNVAPGLFFLNEDLLAAGGLLRVRGQTQSSEAVFQIDPTTKKAVPRPIDLGPATDRVYIILYGTGFRFNSGLSRVSLEIGGVTEPVLYAGKQGAFAGLDQANALIPRSMAGRGKIGMILTADGINSNQVYVTVK